MSRTTIWVKKDLKEQIVQQETIEAIVWNSILLSAFGEDET